MEFLHPAMWHVALGSGHWIHQVAVGLPCNVTHGSGMTCHCIRQVAGPCNVACGSGIMTLNSPSGSRPTLQRDTWLWDDMSLYSPGGSTLQCGMWLWNHDSEFTKWQHPPMWHVDLGSWHWIRQVAAPCNLISGSGMTCHWIRPKGRHIEILHLVLILTISPQSTCHTAPVCKILSKSDQPRQKKMTSCRFSRWRIWTILDFRGPIMGSLKSPCTTSLRSSIDTVTLKCLVFEKIVFLFLYFGDTQTDRQTNKQTNRWTESMH